MLGEPRLPSHRDRRGQYGHTQSGGLTELRGTCSRSCRVKATTVDGLVTLLNQLCEKPALPKVSSCRDRLAPRAHRQGAKRAMRLS